MDAAAAILVRAAASSDAIGDLYALHKRRHPRASLAAVCKKSGIPSRGYLSEVVNGKRVLHSKHVAGLARALELGEQTTRCLALLVARDNATDAPAREAAARELEVLRKGLAIAFVTLPAAPGAGFFAFEVFCAFGLFGNDVAVADLTQYFGEERREDVNAALSQLSRWGMIEEQHGRFRHGRDFIIFGASEDRVAHLDFLRHCLADAHARVESWFQHSGRAYIESTMLSVNRARYEAALPRIKELLRQAQAELSTVADADMIARFNVQIYPAKAP